MKSPFSDDSFQMGLHTRNERKNLSAHLDEFNVSGVIIPENSPVQLPINYLAILTMGRDTGIITGYQA